MTYDPKNQFLYVLGGSIAAYNRQGVHQPLSGNFPHSGTFNAMLYNARNGLIYVAYYGQNSGSMGVFDENGNPQPAGKFHDMPSVPEAMTCDPSNGTIYITNYDGGVAAYTVKGKKIAGSFAGTTHATGIAYDPHNHLVYVLNGNGSGPTVTAYTTAGVTVSLPGKWSGTSLPIDLTFDPQNDRLYLTNFSSGKVTAYDENGNQQRLTGFSGMAPALGIGPIVLVPQ